MFKQLLCIQSLIIIVAGLNFSHASTHSLAAVEVSVAYRYSGFKAKMCTTFLALAWLGSLSACSNAYDSHLRSHSQDVLPIWATKINVYGHRSPESTIFCLKKKSDILWCSLGSSDHIQGLFSRESDSTFTNVCLSVCPSVIKTPQHLEIIILHSFILPLSSFFIHTSFILHSFFIILHHSSFILPSFRDF